MDGKKAENDMNFYPDVSIIIPVFNAARYLSDCLDSVIGQTFRNLEAICIDDGSTDASGQILASYARQDSRIRVIRLPFNQGAGAARNAGLDAARGKIISFLDSDDTLSSDALSSLLSFFQANALDVLYFGVRIRYESASLKYRFPDYLRLNAPEPTPVCTGAVLFRKMIRRGSYNAAPGHYLYALEHIRGKGLRFPEGITHEDEPFTFAGLLSADRTAAVQECCYQRLIRASSVTTSGVTVEDVRSQLAAYRSMALFSRTAVLDAEPKKSVDDYLSKRADILRRNCRSEEIRDGLAMYLDSQEKACLTTLLAGHQTNFIHKVAEILEGRQMITPAYLYYRIFSGIYRVSHPAGKDGR